jgi:TRAP-type transport system periplasmic protein
MKFGARVILSLFVLASSLVFGVLAAGAAHQAGGAARDSTVQWTFMTVAPPASPKGGSLGNYLQAFSNDVYKQTNGQLKITVDSPGVLPYANAETLQIVGQGLVQMGDGGAFIAGESTVAGLPQLPFLVRTVPDFRKIVPALLPYLKKDFATFGSQLLFYYSWPAQVLWGQGEPVTSLSGFSGKKIRVSSAMQSDLVTALHGTPVTLGPTDVTPSLQRGVIDGLMTAGLNAYPAGWGSFLKWGYLLPANIVPSFIVVNNKALASLPPAVRATLRRVATTWQKKMLASVPHEETLYDNALAKDFGLKLTRPSAADVAGAVKMEKPYWANWAASHGLTKLLKSVEKTLHY